jgi:two-component system, NtrC family, nitrogen regulation response regulator NtrX
LPVILVIEDEAQIRDIIAETLTHLNFAVALAATAAGAINIVKDERSDAILPRHRSSRRPGDIDPDRAKKLRPDVPVIMLTANAGEELARETLRRGAFDYM